MKQAYQPQSDALSAPAGMDYVRLGFSRVDLLDMDLFLHINGLAVSELECLIAGDFAIVDLQAALDKAEPKWQVLPVFASKIDTLRDLIRSCGSCVVAYSGGVDSVFLARVAYETLRERSLAVIADSPSLPRRELEEALDIARQVGFPVRVIRTREFDNPDYLANPANRCYFCKHELFSDLVALAKKEGFATIVYGENSSDMGDVRPGARAAAEFQVRAPLREAGLNKEEIRAWSARFGLPTADKPQMACLSSRIPQGEKVTPEKLGMIEAAEIVLRDMGFYDVRVRHHELPAGPWRPEHGLGQNSGKDGKNRELGREVRPCLARIEVGASEMAKLLEGESSSIVSEKLKQLGYTYVTLDLRGYRRGSVSQKVSGNAAVMMASRPTGGSI